MPIHLPRLDGSIPAGGASSVASDGSTPAVKRGPKRVPKDELTNPPLAKTGVKATGPRATGGVAASAFVQFSAADQAAAATLGVELVVALRRVFAKARDVHPVEADRILAMLAGDKAGQQRALGALLQRNPNTVDPSGVARLAQARPPAKKVCWQLQQWARRKAMSGACSGVHDSLVTPLREQLNKTPAAELFWDAIDGINTRKRGFSASTGLGEYLVAQGCLAPGVWTLVPEFIPGSDPIAVLAGHPSRADAIVAPERHDRPVYAMWRKRLLEAGLLDAEVWKSHMVSLYVARGVVGEWLRLLQVRDLPESDGREIVQGALVLVAPPELWACQDSLAARAWCEANGHKARGLYHVPSADGSHYGVLLTEVDVTVLERRGDELAIVRLDNVKACDGHGPEARHQNEVVSEALKDPNFHFCLPNDQGNAYEDVAPRLVRDPATLAAIRTDTVGPEGAGEYSVQLPLLETEIVTLTKDLIRDALGRA